MDRPAVLATGAKAGNGRAAARQLATRGIHAVIAARPSIAAGCDLGRPSAWLALDPALAITAGAAWD